ncbi:hypothetical protein [Methanoculleus sp.]|uniref:hypothetical protein n=1 Tax=Methanoculleus sp. TaxID=90427 RepID=UPI0025EE6A58|nr:hypothetical protein [Methanoculleus sp.]MCK9318181.1 hypothetical protein [Methanoculleus sp.]
MSIAGAEEEAGGRAGNDCRNGRSLRRPEVFEWGSQVESYGVETGEGASPLPVSPSPRGDIPTVQCTRPDMLIVSVVSAV